MPSLPSIVATSLLASPLLVSAQTVGTGGEPASSQQLIALYTQLIHVLEQELGTLIATRGAAAPLPSTPPASNPTPQATSASQ